MFEQESYDRATEPTVVSQPGELFHNYEMKSWFSTQTLYKVLAISAVLNLVFLAVVSQTNVLTARGCDSPWVGRVCQVVDMAYVGALLFGTEREYADVAYDRTELSPDDEIVYWDVTNVAPPLDYPQGYFQIANPVDYQNRLLLQNTTGSPSGVPIGSSLYNPSTNNDADILKQQANPPPANSNAFTDDSASSPLYKVDNTPSTNTGTFSSRKGRGGRIPRPSNSNNTNTSPGETTVAGNNGNANTQQITPLNPSAEQTDEAKADQNGVFINKRPLRDRAKETVALVEAKDLKLDKSFKVVIEGTLGIGKDGKTTVLKNPKPLPVDANVPNDPEMVKLVQDWILTVGDAGWFGYVNILDDPKVKNKSGKVVITIEQNDTNFLANIRSEKTSEETARKIASGLGGLLQIAAGAASGDEQTFLKAANPPTSEGKALILNFSFPKPLVQELIQRKLAEAKAEKAEPNSTAVNSGKSTTASK